jgi:hypothetical protein
MASMLASSVVDRGLEPLLGQAKYYFVFVAFPLSTHH